MISCMHPDYFMCIRIWVFLICASSEINNTVLLIDYLLTCLFILKFENRKEVTELGGTEY